MADHTFEPFLRAATEHLIASMGLTYEDIAANYEPSKPNLDDEMAAALAPLFAPVPTRDSDLPACGYFHG